ncbi:MAG TPA: hypothetical protein VKW08_16460 [Xanthobacteraceae bacterium]|jgi:hypothetical protein|nr:hypothetical protein [Xanthobacteraceae bacterium]
MSEYISQRAAECRRLMDAETDELRKMAFRLLCEMWLSLAQARAGMTKEELDRQIAELDRMQVDYLGRSQIH